MADKSAKLDENVPGSYYVDDQCIACDACVIEAPNFFKMNDDYAFVYKQPESDSEKAECEAALEACPVEAIGNDG